jgi:hypothetical protein
MRPRPMYAFRVILLMPRYAYAAYPTVGTTNKTVYPKTHTFTFGGKALTYEILV